MTQSFKDNGFTPTDLQEMLKDDLEKTLKEVSLTAPSGKKTSIKAYSQGLPVPQEIDDDDENDRAPYIIVDLRGGKKESDGEYVITFGIVICVFNNDPQRVGHFELLNVIQRLENRYAKNSFVGNFEVRDEFEFALQESDFHPYYFGGVILKFNAPKTKKEVSFLT